MIWQGLFCNFWNQANWQNVVRPNLHRLPSDLVLRCHLKLSRSCWSGFSTRGFATPSACWRDRPRNEEEAGRRGGYIGTAAGMDTLASNNRPPHSIQLRRCLTRHFDEVFNWWDIKEGEKGGRTRNRAEESALSRGGFYTVATRMRPAKATEA